MKLQPWRALLSTALLCAVVATPCLAQQDGGRRGGRGGDGGPGGPGGGRFGGGMMGGMFGQGGDAALLGLLRVEAVQKEIKMEDTQVAALEKIDLRGDTTFDFRNASEQERNEYREKMGKQATEQLQELLLPAQLERAREIALQMQGSGALSDPEVAKKLELTDEQKKKLEELQTQNREKMGTAMREARESGDREAVGAKMTELRKSALEDAKGVLNDDQKQKFETLVGKPFEISPEDLRGTRGPRGGRDGGGRGGDRDGGARGGDRDGAGRGGDRDGGDN